MDLISLSFTRKSNNQQQNVYFLMQPRVAFKLEELQHQCPPSAYFQFSISVSERWGKRGNGIFKKKKEKKSTYSWRNAVFKCQSQILMWITCVRRMQDTLNCGVTIVTKLFVPTSAFIWFSGSLFGGRRTNLDLGAPSKFDNFTLVGLLGNTITVTFLIILYKNSFFSSRLHYMDT